MNSFKKSVHHDLNRFDSIESSTKRNSFIVRTIYNDWKMWNPTKTFKMILFSMNTWRYSDFWWLVSICVYVFLKIFIQVLMYVLLEWPRKKCVGVKFCTYIVDWIHVGGIFLWKWEHDKKKYRLIDALCSSQRRFFHAW